LKIIVSNSHDAFGAIRFTQQINIIITIYIEKKENDVIYTN